MIDVSKLPKKPEDAAYQIVTELETLVYSYPDSVLLINIPKIAEYRLLARTIFLISERIFDTDVKDILQRNFKEIQNIQISAVRKQLTSVKNTLDLLKLDNHFINDENVEIYDEAKLSKNERDDIRDCMKSARVLTSEASTIPDKIKIRINHHISKIENELYKDKVGLQAFLAAGYDLSRLVNQFGNDVKPIAEAIETSRTITEKKVQGYNQIEADPEPKKLPPPKE